MSEGTKPLAEVDEADQQITPCQAAGMAGR